MNGTLAAKRKLFLFTYPLQNLAVGFCAGLPEMYVRYILTFTNYSTITKMGN